MMEFDLEVDIENALASMRVLQDQRKRKNAMKASKYAAAKVIHKAAHQELGSYDIEDQTGTLKKSLKLAKTAIRKSKTGSLVWVLGGGRKGLAYDDSAWYAHFLEMGTNRIRPRRFLIGTARKYKDEAIAAFMTRWNKWVDDDLKKMKK